MTDDWPELAELVEQLKAENAAGWQRAEQVRVQLAALQPNLEIIARQFEDLRVDSHLRLLNERLLGGLGSVEVIHSGLGIEHVAALVWPAQVEPPQAPEGGQESGEEARQSGVYRIEVWLGPSLEDGRARIRIAGARRLEATLPTSVERFRTALLSVFRSPQFVERPLQETAPEEAAPEEASGAQAENEPPSQPQSEAQAAAEPPPAPPEEPPGA